MTTPTIHTRVVWQDPKMPVVGPALPWRTIDTNSIHYTAAVNLPDGDLGEFVNDLPEYLRRIQRDYTLNRKPGYSVGYNFAVDWLGGLWELRGFDIKCAANKEHKGVKWNERTVAVLCLVDGADELTNAAVEAVRWIVAETRRRAGRKTVIRGHQEIGATACPGAGIMRQIRSGELEPSVQKPPVVEQPPTPQPPPLEDDMSLVIFVAENPPAVFIGHSSGPEYPAFQLEWLPDDQVINDFRDVGAINRPNGSLQAKTQLDHATLIGPLPPGYEPSWFRQWIG